MIQILKELEEYGLSENMSSKIALIILRENKLLLDRLSINGPLKSSIKDEYFNNQIETNVLNNRG